MKFINLSEDDIMKLRSYYKTNGDRNPNSYTVETINNIIKDPEINKLLDEYEEVRNECRKKESPFLVKFRNIVDDFTNFVKQYEYENIEKVLDDISSNDSLQWAYKILEIVKNQHIFIPLNVIDRYIKYVKDSIDASKEVIMEFAFENEKTIEAIRDRGYDYPDTEFAELETLEELLEVLEKRKKEILEKNPPSKRSTKRSKTRTTKRSKTRTTKRSKTRTTKRSKTRAKTTKRSKTQNKITNDSCVKQTTKKYTERPSPPYPAQECAGQQKMGNDGLMYESVMKANGIYSWKKI